MKPLLSFNPIMSLVVICGLTGCTPGIDNLSELKNYDVIWDSPSTDYTGTMPLGNGETSLNVWIEPNGDLQFYIGRIDSWDEYARLLKVGKVRVSFTPNLFAEGKHFSQRLNLSEGRIEIEAGNPQLPNRLSIWADANSPMVYVTFNGDQSVQMTARIERWRSNPWEPPSYEVSDLLLDRSKPDQKHDSMIIQPDSILPAGEGRIGWFHHNLKSVGPALSMQIQGLSEFEMEDPLMNRTFGAVITGSEGSAVNDSTLVTGGGNSQELSICVMTQYPSSPEEWLDSVEKELATAQQSPLKERLDHHIAWWEQFWNRSWIYASDESGEAHDVTQAYILQRFIDACAGRGAYPIKFNGSIFTVPFPGGPGDADYRRWGPGYWWQNTRLPYLSMCTSGDFEMLKPLFNMYAGEVFELSKYRTKAYFNHPGAYFPECINFWGTVFSESYGWQPASERTDKLQVSGYHKWEWVAGPELVWMMLDYYDHTLAKVFLSDTILPVAIEVMTFFNEFYDANDQGKLVMYPSQAVETWWDCTNPMPELAGLIAISERILKLPEDLLPAESKLWLDTFAAKLPELPLREVDEGMALAPAERYADKRNIENPELYATFPFRLVTKARGNSDLGILALKHAGDRGNFGWRQEEIFMTYLGMAEEAREQLVERAGNKDKNSRFLAFWGPNYDWVPDQDHGGILMKAFQSMLIQADGNDLHLMPAWPEGWNADFKVHVPGKKIIQGRIRDGKIKYQTKRSN